MKVKLIFTPASIIVFLLCLFHPPAKSGERLPSLLISNSWELQAVTDEQGKAAKISSYILSFKANGSWYYRFKSTQGVKPSKHSCRWRVEGTTLKYQCENSKGESQLSIENGILHFNSDPVLMLERQLSLASDYKRSTQ